MTCSYEKELEAMNLVVDWIEENVRGDFRVLICTDSKALCQALLNQRSSTIAELSDNLKNLAGTVIIQWIPGHTNIPGNELADTAAKEATHLEDPPANISYESIKQHIKRMIIDPPIKHERTAQVYKDFNDKAD